MRDTVQAIRVASIEPYKEVVVQYFNLILSSSEYWNTAMKEDLQRKFPGCLTDTELSRDFDLRKAVLSERTSMLFKRIQLLTGVKLDAETITEMNHTNGLELVVEDIQKISVRIKFMNVIEFASAMASSVQAKQIEGRVAERLFGIADKKFASAVALYTNSPQVRLQKGITK
jgi:hypothetical protein